MSDKTTLDTSGATGFSLTPIDWDASAPVVVTPHPAFKKPWVGLTDEEIQQIEMSASSILSAIYLAEAQLKGKNNG